MAEREQEGRRRPYQKYPTITLQGTLVNLRVATKLHGETERTQEIERLILDELEMRGEKV
jgi:hypothetical protein